MSGLSGIRSLARVGFSIYCANNTDIIYSPTLSGIIGGACTTAPVITVNANVGNVRWITYNENGNSGAGSFYVGNFDTSIFEISTTGDILREIPATVHSLSGMYGAVYDVNSQSVLILWINRQSVIESEIIGIDLNTGSPSGLTRNVDNDIPVPSLAGGLTIGTSINGVPNTLIALAQGSQIIGYNLESNTVLSDDCSQTKVELSNHSFM